MLQEALELPANRWNFGKFYSDKPDEVDSFLCKVLAAGAVAIYLDILAKADFQENLPEGMDQTERVIRLFNALLREITLDRRKAGAEADPFQLDAVFKGIPVDEALRKAYRKRAAVLFNTFEQKYEARNCDELLGFDPFRYEEYDEETQEKIEEGAWMGKCADCMQHVIRTVCAG